jgi:hypothetical protein
MQKVLKLEPEAAWQEHLKHSYDAVAEMHSHSYVSWGKARIRKANVKETTVGTLGQAGAVVSGVSGGLGVIGVAVPTSAVGVAAGVGAAAITLYALPVAVVALASVVWVLDKREHKQVNEEIWKYWCENCRPTLQEPHEHLDEGKARKWLAWFGAEGFSNMSYLGDKLQKAKDAYDNAVTNLKDSLKDLGIKIQVATKLKEPQRSQTLLQLRPQAETLAGKYLELAKPLEYLRYRLERTIMYHQMLHFTVRSLLFRTKAELTSAATEVRPGFDQQIQAYHDLWGAICGAHQYLYLSG